MAGGGDWLLVQELFARGDPEFVERIRQIADADALGAFAERWYNNSSPAARRLLLVYLERPLNAFRHEALVKRLFKRAEAAGDDAVMARFLVAFDRSIRRVERRRYHYKTEKVETHEQARKLAAQWTSEGYDRTMFYQPARGTLVVTGTWSESYLTAPSGTTMPRGKKVEYYVGFDLARMKARTILAPDWVGRLRLDPREHHDSELPPESLRSRLERYRLFSIKTRQYLRRRFWRYFRRLGKMHPERYVAAITEALVLYEDADVATGLALIDNWGLVHALFHHSPVLEAHPRGWRPADERSLSELEPAPIFESLWKAAPRSLFDLLVRARCRPVRRWAVAMLSRDPASLRTAVGLDELLGLLAHDDPDVIALVSETLRGAEGLAKIPAARWLAVAEAAGPLALETLADLMARHIAPGQVSLADAARLAASRPLPLARLGLSWLKSRSIATAAERAALLPLLDAEAEPLRPEILAWLRSALAEDPEFRAGWVLAFLDSRFPDARSEGMSWFRAEPRARDDVTLWQRLLESPHDDVRLALAAELEARLSGGPDPLELSPALDPDRLRLLWASVLLNVRRGGRVKPGVIGQVARRLALRPEEAGQLLPLLTVALRSLRGPERRAALAAVVRLVEHHPDAAPLVRLSIPELQWP
jgi:hypothetical protein